jgi:hypothetical protein
LAYFGAAQEKQVVFEPAATEVHWTLPFALAALI